MDIDIAIKCPHCNEIIELSEAISEQVQSQMRAEIEKQIEENVRKRYELDIADLRQQVEEQAKRLEEARKAELELRKRRRELEDRIRSLDLEVARRIDEERRKIEEEVTERLSAEYHLKDKEKDKQLNDLKAQVNELKRKLEQGSQQLQGEVAEIALKERLTSLFPQDEIVPVGKGMPGADVLQKVYTAGGQYCGTIIWESKNTKHWNEQWLTKLKDDQISAKAEVAILVSTALPESVKHFANISGVWVTGFAYVAEVATVLRENLVQLHKARLAEVGKDDKMELIYSYLSGPEFRQRITAIVESFIALREDLEREKRSMQRIWAKRDKQIERVINNIAGMYGDMQGIISLPVIEPLSLPDASD